MIMMSIIPPIALGAVAYGRFVSKIARKTTHATADLTKLAEGTGFTEFTRLLMREMLTDDRKIEQCADCAGLCSRGPGNTDL